MKTSIEIALEAGASTDEINQFISKENSKFPNFLKALPKDKWPPMNPVKKKPIEVLRSREFLVQIYDEAPYAFRRISVCRARLAENGRWEENISWDELMKIKKECGFEKAWACELYPPPEKVVNVAAMRHLWVLIHPPEFGWNL